MAEDPLSDDITKLVLAPVKRKKGSKKQIANVIRNG